MAGINIDTEVKDAGLRIISSQEFKKQEIIESSFKSPNYAKGSAVYAVKEEPYWKFYTGLNDQMETYFLDLIRIDDSVESDLESLGIKVFSNEESLKVARIRDAENFRFENKVKDSLNSIPIVFSNDNKNFTFPNIEPLVSDDEIKLGRNIAMAIGRTHKIVKTNLVPKAVTREALNFFNDDPKFERPEYVYVVNKQPYGTTIKVVNLETQELAFSVDSNEFNITELIKLGVKEYNPKKDGTKRKK